MTCTTFTNFDSRMHWPTSVSGWQTLDGAWPYSVSPLYFVNIAAHTLHEHRHIATSTPDRTGSWIAEKLTGSLALRALSVSWRYGFSALPKPALTCLRCRIALSQIGTVAFKLGG